MTRVAESPGNMKKHCFLLNSELGPDNLLYNTFLPSSVTRSP